jgi:hypothetical protein
MGRLFSAFVATVGLLVMGAPAATAEATSAALAEPTPAPGAGPTATPATVLCTVNDKNLREISGLVATANGYAVMNDGSGSPARDRVFQLDKSCRVTKSQPYASPGPRDPEDLATGKDGSLWVADIGDNSTNTERRSTIALWKFSANLTGTPALYRLRYPNGPHDAEALLLAADDSPIIVTKGTAKSDIYVPVGPLTVSRSQNQFVDLKKVGEFTPQRTGTSNPLALLGYFAVTGGANSPDRSKVAIRTYADAYEWDVPDGDVVKAVTTGKPRVTPLPDEEWGEAIAYTRDSAAFLTVSDLGELPADRLAKIRQYTPAATDKPANAAPPGISPKKNTLSWYERMSLQEATMLVAGIGVLGVLLVIIGILGIRRARSRTQLAPSDGPDDRGSSPGGPQPAAALSSARAPGLYGGGTYAASTYRGSNPGQQPGWQGDGYDEPHGYGPPSGDPPRGGR